MKNIKETLEKEKERLSAQLTYYKSEDPYLTEDRNMTSTLDDDITENEGHDRITASQNEAIDQLNQVNAALARLEKGTYGICTNCGDNIPQERLMIMPTAHLCMKCENKK